MTPCAIDGCRNEAKRPGGLCHGHYHRKRTGQPINVELAPRGRSAWDVLWDAILDVNDLRPSDDLGWERAKKRIEIAADRWARSRRRNKRKNELYGRGL